MHAQVDKLWSVAPVYYFWHFALHDQLKTRGVPVNVRLLAMSTLASVWGIRLTLNFARKGGYRWMDEDYRCGQGLSCLAPAGHGQGHTQTASGALHQQYASSSGRGWATSGYKRCAPSISHGWAASVPAMLSAQL